MATHFSWTGYFLVVGAAVTIYYVIIGIRYYRQDIKALLQSRSGMSDKPKKPPPVKTGGEFPIHEICMAESLEPENLNEELPAQEYKSEMVTVYANEPLGEHRQKKIRFTRLQKLGYKIKLAILDAYQKGHEEADLLFQIQVLANEFSNIKRKKFRVEIEKLILRESAKYGYTNLCAFELTEIWKGV